MKIIQRSLALLVALISLIYINATPVYATATGSQEEMSLSYEAHVQNIGWQPSIKSSEIGGTVGRELRLEAVKINLQNPLPNVNIKYRTHVQDKGWLSYVENGQVSGTTGESLRIEAIQIELVGAPEGYGVQYQAYVQGKGWMDWVENGAVAGTTGQSLRLEALKIKIVNTNSSSLVRYKAHVQNIGWQTEVYSEEIAGTVGKNFRMEAITVNLENLPATTKVKYRTHVQDKGWLPYVINGQVSGTTGESLRVEAIQIELEGAPEGYHIQYQTYVEGKGWMDWVEDGQVSGTTGESRRLEALKIKIVKNSIRKTIVLDAGHGGSDPGAVANGYKEKDLNMQIVQKLGEKLKAKGFNILYTRQPNNDVFIDLPERTKFANDNNADLFISIHHDSNVSSSANGTSTHYSSYRPAIETKDAYVEYNGKKYPYLGEEKIGNKTFVYYNDNGARKSVDLNYATVYDPTPSEEAIKSKDLSDNLVVALSGLGVANRGSKDHNLYVTRWTNMPSVLIEVGFISNSAEINKIAQPSYQDKVAQKIADTIIAAY